MKKWLLLIVASLMFIFAGCGDKKEETSTKQPEEDTSTEVENDTDEELSEDINKESAEAALDVLEENMKYANAQDVDGYLKAIRKEEHDMTREVVEETFAQGKITFDMLESEIVSADEEYVEIGVVQTTVADEPIAGFEDNVMEILYTLTFEDDAWKIYKTEVLSQDSYEE